jgi:hypothetical protein
MRADVRCKAIGPYIGAKLGKTCHSLVKESPQAGSHPLDTTLPIRRPKRWDKPLDPALTQADAEWLLGLAP